MLGILIRRVKFGHKDTLVGCHVMMEAGIDVYTNIDVWGKENFSLVQSGLFLGLGEESSKCPCCHHCWGVRERKGPIGTWWAPCSSQEQGGAEG